MDSPWAILFACTYFGKMEKIKKYFYFLFMATSKILWMKGSIIKQKYSISKIDTYIFQLLVNDYNK